MATEKQDKNLMYIKILEEHTKLIQRALSSIAQTSRNKAEYDKTDEEKIKSHDEYFAAFGNRERWPFYGILDEKELAQLSFIEHLLDENSTSVKKYSKWKKSTP